MRLGAILIAATAFVAEAHAEPPEARVWVARAKEALDAGRLEEALDAIERALAIDPRPELINNHGFILEALGRYQEAAAAYRRVIESPDAAPELRELDRQRLRNLAPKLQSAEVRFERLEAGTEACAGSACSFHEGDQLVTPGPSVLVIRSASRAELAVRFLDLPIGRRSVIDVGSLSAEPNDGFVRFEGEHLRSLAVDGRALRWVPESGMRLRLASGPHRLTAITIGDERSSFDVSLEPGETIALMRPPQPLPNEVLAVEVPTSSIDPVPWIVIAGGVAVAIAGGVLLGLAHADAARIDDAAAEDPVASLTYEEAVELEGRAGRYAPAGVGLLVTGGVAIVAGAIYGAIGR